MGILFCGQKITCVTNLNLQGQPVPSHISPTCRRLNTQSARPSGEFVDLRKRRLILFCGHRFIDRELIVGTVFIFSALPSLTSNASSPPLQPPPLAPKASHSTSYIFSHVLPHCTSFSSSGGSMDTQATADCVELPS